MTGYIIEVAGAVADDVDSEGIDAVEGLGEGTVEGEVSVMAEEVYVVGDSMGKYEGVIKSAVFKVGIKSSDS